jgi:hypothetical protein
MNALRTADGDRVLPTEIEHRCEEMFDSDRLTQKYNYVVYHFENAGHYHWARAYLEDIDTVALFGPLDNRITRGPDGRRCAGPPSTAISRNSGSRDDGYRVIWSRDR